MYITIQYLQKEGGVDRNASLPGHPSRPSSCNSFRDMVHHYQGVRPPNQLVGKSLGPGLPPVGSRVGATEKKNAIGSSVQNGHSAGATETELTEIAASLSGLASSKTGQVNENCLVQSKLQMNLDSQPDVISSIANDKKCSLQQIVEDSSSENLPYSAKYGGLLRKNGMVPNLNSSIMGSNGQINIPKRTSSFADLYSRGNSW